MITYQIQDRVISIKNGSRELEFPNDLKIEAEYGPAEAFGVSNNPSGLCVKGNEFHFIYNANNGRVLSQSIPPLPPLFTRIEQDNVIIELSGTTLRIQTKCENSTELLNILLTCLHGYPSLFNIEFPDPPVMLTLTGSLGRTEFRWEFEEATSYFRPKSKEELENHVFNSINNLPKLPMQYLAACTYFYTASRLIASGYTQWDFMAESILNLCKTLQILFGESMDNVRYGLKQIGYSTEEIEIDFIPLVVLRNNFDVAHTQSIIPQSDQLKVLYRYLIKSEDHIRDLLKVMFDQIIDGTLLFESKNYFEFDREKQLKFNQIIETIKDKIDRPGTPHTKASADALCVRFSSQCPSKN